MTKTERIQQLVKATLRTHEIDESGDATLYELMSQFGDQWTDGEHDGSVADLLEIYLVWANGPDWEQFLAGADVGDTPLK